VDEKLDGHSELALINAIANTLIIPADWLTISSYSEVGQSIPIPGFSLSVSFSFSVPLSPNDVAVTVYNNYIDSLNEAFDTGALKQNLLTTISIFEAVVISSAEVQIFNLVDLLSLLKKQRIIQHTLRVRLKYQV